MKITLNGATRELPDGPLTVSGLLVAIGLGPAPVLVERNGLAVLRREFEEMPVAEGDTIEIVRMVAGG
jgi:thiamine biosynthesis protein ThiS